MQTIDSFLTEWTTAERDGDTGKLDALLTSDFTAVGPLGFIISKEGWLARHRQGDLAYQSFGIEEVQTRLLGEVAVVTARGWRARREHGGHGDAGGQRRPGPCWPSRRPPSPAGSAGSPQQARTS